jgi:hypothetical protein
MLVRYTQVGLLLVILTSMSWAQDYSRHYEAPFTSDAVLVDGVLDEPAWTSAPWTETYILYGTLDGSTTTSTRAKILWDVGNLYIGVEAMDEDIWSTYTERDDHLWKEDAIEFFIDPEGDAEGYMEFEVSPRNTVYDDWIEKPLFSQGGPSHLEDWTAEGFHSAVQIEGTLGGKNTDSDARRDRDVKWVMEAALPWEDCAIVSGSRALPPNPGDTWRMNVTRYDYRADDKELSQWSPSDVGGAWHEPKEYGYVTFVNYTSGAEASSWAWIKAFFK